MSCGEPLKYPATGLADWSSVPFEDRISRRDLYAAAALSGILSVMSRDEVGGPISQVVAIRKAFGLADRMLEERGKA